MLKLPTDKRRFWALCSIAAALILGSLIWKVPHRGIPDSITDEKVKAELLNANRDNFLKGIQAIAGLGFIVTAVLAWKNLKLTEDKTVTDRFSKAVEMLADSKKLEVRLGGIYSLERIARDSKADHPVVMEVLTAFVRARSTPGEEEKITLPQDIQSTLTVIGRRTPTENEQRIDLSGAFLRKANLTSANLNGADLSYANLSSAYLNATNLSGTNLSSAILSDTDLSGASLSGASLSGANLTSAKLVGANLTNAKLYSAILSDTDFYKANLYKTNLSGADLSGASLNDTDLSGASLCKANLCKANLSGAKLHRTNLYYADLSSARLNDADLESIIWNEKTTWPNKAEVAKAKNIPADLKTQLDI